MAGLRDYTGRTALVTGASSGIGAELSALLAKKGMRVALVARRRERLEALASKIGRAGGEASVYPCDIRDRAAVQATMAEAMRRYDGLDLLVNCAGYARHLLFKDHEVDDIEQMVQTNFLGTVYWIKEVLPVMRKQGCGWIVNLSSFAGLISQPDEAAYTATKFAVTGLSEAIACEFEPLGIHVMCVHPVLVETEMFTPEVMARMPKETTHRFMSAERFAVETLEALERGEHHVVLPRSYRGVVLLKSLFPKMMTRKISAVKLKALKDLKT